MSLFEGVQKELITCYQYLTSEFSQDLFNKILTPERIIHTTLSISGDDGHIQTFQAWRSQYNNARGPYKGGIRFHPNVSEDEVVSLSARMSLKTAVVGIPLGGGKGGIIVDPKKLSKSELEKLSRAYVRSMWQYFGPQTDIPAPDVNTDGQIMARMVDEYSTIVGSWQPGVITGKPLALGGSAGRELATSMGGLIVLQTYLENKGQSLQGKTILVQGAGNVGLNFAILAQQAGATIVGISDSQVALYNPQGLDMQNITTIKKQGGSLSVYDTSVQIGQQEFLFQKADILVPAALENQITEANAHQVSSTLILELANGPVSPAADQILASRDIVVIPDVLANAGGVTVSYFEQVQNAMNYYRTEDEVNAKLKPLMVEATQAVIAKTDALHIPLRKSAYVLALHRILEAEKLRSGK